MVLQRWQSLSSVKAIQFDLDREDFLDLFDVHFRIYQPVATATTEFHNADARRLQTRRKLRRFEDAVAVVRSVDGA